MPTHTRIRMFNTRQTYPNQALDNDLCQAVRAGNTIYVRGQIGTDFDGNLVGLGDPRAQAEQAMKNVKQLLEEAGSDLSHIVKTTTYLIDPRYREPVYQEQLDNGEIRINGQPFIHLNKVGAQKPQYIEHAEHRLANQTCNSSRMSSSLCPEKLIYIDGFRVVGGRHLGSIRKSRGTG
jgi:enamine deaminase RidA (YjgF/YER057c/UK114 family)